MIYTVRLMKSVISYKDVTVKAGNEDAAHNYGVSIADAYEKGDTESLLKMRSRTTHDLDDDWDLDDEGVEVDDVCEEYEE